MQFLTPLFFLLSLLALPILLLYMLKLRRTQTPVSSTMLWEKLLRDRQANTFWQKLKRNLLLFFQLLILAALVFALARPAFQTQVIASGQVIVLLDASASMNAVDVFPSRFESARQAARDLINGLGGDSTMTLILVGQSPQTLIAAESDKTRLKSALDAAQVTFGRADWSAAFALAAGALRGGQDANVVILSDGGLPQQGLPPLPQQARYLPVGTLDANLAISALALRASKGQPQLFAEVSNYSGAARSVLFSLYLGESLLMARRVEVPAHGKTSLNFDNLSPQTAVYKAKISRPDSDSPLDLLELDNTAFAVYQASSARRVLLVSPGNVFLEQLLASLPGIQPFRALPAEDGSLQIPVEPFDLYIFDGVLPDVLPNANLLLIHPPSNLFFEVGADLQNLGSMQTRQHTLVNHVDWNNVHVLKAQSVTIPSWMTPLVESESMPLVFAGERGGQRVAALSFDLRQSDLPLQLAYPILFSNLINYLAPPAAFDSSQSLSAGETLSLVPQMDALRVVVVSPSAQAYSLATAQNFFNQTGELGYYAVNFIGEESMRAEYFAVNLFAPEESDIAVRENLQIGSAEVAPAAFGQLSLQEIWQWLAGAALLLLMLEWQAFHRKPLFSKRPKL